MEAETSTDVQPQPPAGAAPRPRDESVLDLPFDHYERHALTAAVMDVLREQLGKPRLRILDIGGGPASLSRFLPADEIIAADLEEGAGEGYMRADGTKLPFLDDAFDAVVCHDTLEHVPEKRRDAFLAEMTRVASDFVLVNGPFLDPRVQAAERLVMQVAKETMGEDYATVRYLSEHAEHGLPDIKRATKQLTKLGLAHMVVRNGALDDWLAKMLVKHYAAALAAHGVAAHELDRVSNKGYRPVAEPEPTYRHALLAAKRDEELLGVLHEKLEVGVAAPARDSSARALPVEVVKEAVERFSWVIDAGLAAKGRHITDKDRHIANLEAEKEFWDKRFSTLETAVRDANARAQGAESALHRVTGTVGYLALEKLRARINRIAPPGSTRRMPLVAATRAGKVVLTEGWLSLARKAPGVWRWGPNLRQSADPAIHGLTYDEQYQLWLKAHALTPKRRADMKRRCRQFTFCPTISIITPVYNTDPSWLHDAIESVRAQLYENWELCLADDGSTNRDTLAVLRAYERKDPRIKIAYLQENGGISAASNAALALATGAFAGLLDHDDELKPDALYRVVKILNEDPELDFIYSDEDKKELDGRVVEPFFKPDWSPDLLMSENYVSHFGVFRKSLLDQIGGFRVGYEGSQDHDLVLRLSEVTDKIAHIARPLYTWRKVPGSAAGATNAKLFALDASKRALKDALERRGLQGEVEDGLIQLHYRVRYRIDGAPKVGIIIPTRDRVEMLRRAIDSIERKSTYRNFEIIVIDNDSKEPATLDYLSTFGGRVVRFPHGFHFARMINLGAQEAADCGVLLFLNNDTEVITAGWLEAMLEHAQRPPVAAVGARLLYPDGRVQHEGVIMGLGTGSALNADHRGYFGLGQTVRNMSAVTGACLMTRASVFQELEGFDENLSVAFNDVDYCLRAREKGYAIVYTPFAELYHYESASRGTLHPWENELYFRRRWGNPGEYRDPYYNPNLDLARPFNIKVS